MISPEQNLAMAEQQIDTLLVISRGLGAELDSAHAEIERLRALVDELTGGPEFDGIPYLRLALTRTLPEQKTVTFMRETLVQAVRQCAAFTEDH